MGRRRNDRPRHLRSGCDPSTRRHFGRILAAYGGVFVAGSLLWAVVMDGFRPDRYDIIGALICLCGVGVIMYAR